MFAGKTLAVIGQCRLFVHLYKKWVSLCGCVCVCVCFCMFLAYMCLCAHAGGQYCNIMCILRDTGCRTKTTRDLKQIFGELI